MIVSLVNSRKIDTVSRSYCKAGDESCIYGLKPSVVNIRSCPLSAGIIMLVVISSACEYKEWSPPAEIILGVIFSVCGYKELSPLCCH